MANRSSTMLQLCELSEAGSTAKYHNFYWCHDQDQTFILLFGSKTSPRIPFEDRRASPQRRVLVRQQLFNNNTVLTTKIAMAKRITRSSALKGLGTQQLQAVSAFLLATAITLALWLQWPCRPAWSLVLAFVAVLFVYRMYCCFLNQRLCRSTSAKISSPVQSAVFHNHNTPPIQSPPPLRSNTNDDSLYDFSNLVGSDAKTARIELLVANFPRYRRIEIYPEGASMTADKQFYRLRMIVDKHSKVKRIQSMV